MKQSLIIEHHSAQNEKVEKKTYVRTYMNAWAHHNTLNSSIHIDNSSLNGLEKNVYTCTSVEENSI